MRFAKRGQLGQGVFAAREHGFDDAVHQQIRVAADGAGEVRVGGVGQAEVAAVGGGVESLAHGAQEHGVDLGGVGPGGNLFGNALDVGRLRLIRHGGAHAQGGQVAAQGGELVGRGRVVHAEKALALAFEHEVGGADVGGEHGFFNQAVRVVALARQDLRDAARFVADDLGFNAVQLHRAARVAGGQQCAVSAGEVLQLGQQGLLPGRCAAGLACEPGGGLRVGQARVAVDDGGVELVGGDGALPVNQHVAHEREAVHLRVERAQAVAEFFRQHGDDAAREINAGGALEGVRVERVAIGHVVAHVGNGHEQPPAIGPLATA